MEQYSASGAAHIRFIASRSWLHIGWVDVYLCMLLALGCLLD